MGLSPALKHTKDMTIAVIGTRGFPGIQGGVEKHCERLYPLMRNVNFRVYRRKPYLTEGSRNNSYSNITFTDLPSTRIKGVEAVLHTLLSVLHIILHRPDAVHVHNIGPGMYTPLLRLLGLKVILTYHSPNYEHKKWGRSASAFLRWCERVSLRYSNHIIFVNKFQREKFGPEVLSKSSYIPNGIDPAHLSEGTDFLNKHNIASGSYVLAVGRITPEKGFEHLIKAAQQLPEVKQVVIAGASDHDTAYAEQLKQLDTLGKVIFTGFTSGEDLRQLYSHARVYVLSSVNEGFPLVLLEAMSYRLPLIVSDIPATHLVELPTDDYFAAGDAESLARCLHAKLQQPAGRVNYDLADFDWQDVARRTESVYAQVLNGGKR